MSDQKIHKLVLAALFAALCTIMTMVIQVPSPVQGYVNLGDCAVLLAAWVLGPLYGGAAAGVGSMLADLLTGYAHYAPGTLVVKGLMALVAGWLFLRIKKGGLSRRLPALLASGVTGELIMILGYFIYEAAPVPVGLGLGALSNVPFNLVQGVFGLVAAGILYLALERSHALARLS